MTSQMKRVCAGIGMLLRNMLQVEESVIAAGKMPLRVQRSYGYRTLQGAVM